MSKVVSKTIKIKTPKLPPDVDFIESEIKKQGFCCLRWAIVDVIEDELILNISTKVECSCK